MQHEYNENVFSVHTPSSILQGAHVGASSLFTPPVLSTYEDVLCSWMSALIPFMLILLWQELTEWLPSKCS
jgi:hypothetical protein